MITDAELTALYGNGLRPDTAARLIDDLRAARAEIEFMRAWCAEHFGGFMPPTREQNAAAMRALDEMEGDRD